MLKGYSRQYYQKQHRKEVFWQIWLPIGIGAVALLSLGVMAGLSLQVGTESAARWGNIATMWLILPVFAVGLLSLFLLSGLIFGVFKLTQILPNYSEIVQMYAQRIFRIIKSTANKSVQPIMSLRSNNAALRRLFIGLQYMLFGGYND
jgi:hypothetical protein